MTWNENNVPATVRFGMSVWFCVDLGFACQLIVHDVSSPLVVLSVWLLYVCPPADGNNVSVHGALNRLQALRGRDRRHYEGSAQIQVSDRGNCVMLYGRAKALSVSLKENRKSLCTDRELGWQERLRCRLVNARRGRRKGKWYQVFLCKSGFRVWTSPCCKH